MAVVKRFEFCSGRTSRTANTTSMSGHNFILWVSASGEIDPNTGMVINLTDLKTIVATELKKYDHQNLDALFETISPTTSLIAQAIFSDLSAVLPENINLESIELLEEEGFGAFVTAPDHSMLVSAWLCKGSKDGAIQIVSEKMLLQSYSIYGPYSWRLELRLETDSNIEPRFPINLEDENIPMPDAKVLFNERTGATTVAALCRALPFVKKARMWTTPSTFWEFDKQAGSLLFGRKACFNAAHVLQNQRLSPTVKSGDCCQHGHTFFIQALVRSVKNQTINSFPTELRLNELLNKVIHQLDATYLNEKIEWFRDRPPTGENLALKIGEELAPMLNGSLQEVRIWETPNNQFILQL